jgi:phage tail sheath protein FI
MTRIPLRTPGVYIEEIKNVSPSVTQVPTAIPAFIGYTEKGPSVPLRISSLVEFEELFGGTIVPKGITIDLDNNIYSIEESKYKLYNSLKLFYLNGGNICYVISIGTYKDNPTFNDYQEFKNGLDQLRKIDEITLLLAPDAVNLSNSNLGNLHQLMLQQCSELKDRFAILDVKPNIISGKPNVVSSCENFRNNVGSNNLKYGAAYYPFLKVKGEHKFNFKTIDDTVNFEKIYASNPEVLDKVQKFKSLHALVYEEFPNKGIIYKWRNNVSQQYKEKLEIENNFINTKDYFNTLIKLLAILGKYSAIADVGLKTIIENNINDTLRNLLQNLMDFKAAFNNLYDPETNEAWSYEKRIPDIETENFEGVWLPLKISSINPYTGIQENSYPLVGNLNKTQFALDSIRKSILNNMDNTIAAIENYMQQQEDILVAIIPIFNEIVTNASLEMNTIPPSGAIAGIYAKIDATRGVWKAPANVKIEGIIELSDIIKDNEQNDMNINISGKSINAIRSFTGRGILVWGSRTLAGNDNEWRYVSVMRTLIMLQESIRNATMQFVFEPNDANTWVRIKAMIDTYLTSLWRSGALQGAKPEHAFYIKSGLGETMIGQDILENRLIVEIGIAVVRPAEFIILKHTQIQKNV